MLKKFKEKYKKMSLPAKAAIWYTFCNFINKGMALLSTPIFTRIMSEEQYGTFAIFQSWFNILIIFTSLNIFLSSYTKGLLNHEKDSHEFTSSLLSLTTFITFIFFLIYILNPEFWTTIFDMPPKLMYAMFVELFTLPAFEFWMAKQRFDYKYKSVIIISICMNVLCLGLSVTTVMLSESKLEARVFSDVFAKFLFAGTFFALIIIRGKKLFNWKYWKYALAFNIPLIPHYLSNYILNQSDRIMIGKMIGSAEAAFYSVSYTISTVIILLVFAIINALTPYVYKTIKNNKTEEIGNKINPIVVLISALTIIVMTLAPEIISIFAGHKYLDAVYVIPPIAVSVYFIFVYSLFSTIEYYYQKTAFISIATTFSALLNLLLNYIFIKKYGYYAAGYTTLFCYIILALCHYCFYKKVIKTEMPDIKNVYNTKTILIISIVLILMIVPFVYLYKFVIIRYLLLLILASFLYLARNKVKETLKLFTNK